MVSYRFNERNRIKHNIRVDIFIKLFLEKSRVAPDYIYYDKQILKGYTIFTPDLNLSSIQLITRDFAVIFLPDECSYRLIVWNVGYWAKAMELVTKIDRSGPNVHARKKHRNRTTAIFEDERIKQYIGDKIGVTIEDVRYK